MRVYSRCCPTHLSYHTPSSKQPDLALRGGPRLLQGLRPKCPQDGAVRGHHVFVLRGVHQGAECLPGRGGAEEGEGGFEIGFGTGDGRVRCVGVCVLCIVIAAVSVK